MKSWEEMKDFSFVGIKITKAKTISEGLTKCKMEKLTRRNPLYEHINFHKLIFGKKECQLCKPISPQVQVSQAQVSPSPFIVQNALNQLITAENKRRKTLSISMAKHRRFTKNQYKSWAKLQTAIESSQNKQIVQKIDKFKIVNNKFDNCLRKTKSTFFKSNTNDKSIHRNFFTQIERLQFNSFEDRELVIEQVKSDRMMMLDQSLQEERRRKSTIKKIKDMKRPIQFPLNQSQIKKIVDNQANIRKTETVKLKKMMSSLYDYKSKIDFQSKMKIVKKLTK